MVNKKLFYVLIIFLIIPLAIAVDTEITVNTGVNQEVTVNVINPVTEDVISTLVGNSSSDGKAVVVFSSDSVMNIDISVVARRDGKIITLKKFAGYRTGSPIYLDLLKVEDKNVTLNATLNNSIQNSSQNTNQTIANLTIQSVNNTNVSENITPEVGVGDGLTGQAVSNSGIFSKLSKTTYYIIIGVVVLVVLVFLALRFGIPILNRQSVTPRIVKFDPKMTKKDKTTLTDKELLKSEQKIKEALEEINKIKNKKKIEEAEKKLEEDKKELEKLKSGK